VLDGLDLLRDDALNGEGVGQPPVGGRDEALGAGIIPCCESDHPRAALRRRGWTHDGGEGRTARRAFRGCRAIGRTRNRQH
jgi:hypothetical protein